MSVANLLILKSNRDQVDAVISFSPFLYENSAEATGSNAAENSLYRYKKPNERAAVREAIVVLIAAGGYALLRRGSA